MKILYAILVATLVATLLTGCGPSAEQMTATAVMAQAQTQTAAPTFTPTATTTPTPTPAPTLTPTPSPTPALPQIMGRIQVNFAPLNDKTIIPQPPFELAMIVSPASGGEKIRIQSSDTDGNFTASLKPGKYSIERVAIKNEALGPKEFEFVTQQKDFTVSSEPCSYVGSVTFTLIRLPPESFQNQVAMVQKIAKGTTGITFQFFETGGMLMPALTDISGAGACPNFPEAPGGFNWKHMPESYLAVLAPNGWNYKHEQNQTTKAYYISLEDINKNGSFKTGLSITVLQDKTKDASQIAKGLPAKIASQKGVTKASEVSEHKDGDLVFYEFEYEASLAYKVTTHSLTVANKATNTLYIITFESPSDQWDEAWKTGQVMIGQIQFLKPGN